LQTKIKNLFPNRQDWKESAGPIARGSVIGFLCGILPGAGAVMSTFLSYTVEKKLSKHPEEFGKGAIAGVAGPETANNAAAGGAFVPMLALGIPPNPIMGILLGSLMIHGVSAGPLLITQHPDIFWGVIASMYVGNIMLVLLNLPLIGMWVKVLKVPPHILLPLILLCCLIGAYSNGNNSADVIIMVIFGVVGYVLRKLNYELAPLIMALVLGPLIESNFRNSLTMSDGGFAIFFQRPISAVVLIIAGLLLISTGFSTYRKTKTKIIEEAGGDDE
jgi:putative tricarboxylic transport membrane protein